MIEICDGCHVSFRDVELTMEFVPVEDPNFPVPFELKLFCPKCFDEKQSKCQTVHLVQ